MDELEDLINENARLGVINSNLSSINHDNNANDTGGRGNPIGTSSSISALPEETRGTL